MTVDANMLVGIKLGWLAGLLVASLVWMAVIALSLKADKYPKKESA